VIALSLAFSALFIFIYALESIYPEQLTKASKLKSYLAADLARTNRMHLR
jgi:hypothetical protein